MQLTRAIRCIHASKKYSYSLGSHVPYFVAQPRRSTDASVGSQRLVTRANTKNKSVNEVLPDARGLEMDIKRKSLQEIRTFAPGLSRVAFERFTVCNIRDVWVILMQIRFARIRSHSPSLLESK